MSMPTIKRKNKNMLNVARQNSHKLDDRQKILTYHDECCSTDYRVYLVQKINVMFFAKILILLTLILYII